MYSQHFGLTQDPFSIAPDPRYLFMSERHREALAHLLYGVARPGSSGTGGGFVLLTGDIGTGKTTICRCFLEQIPTGCRVAYIFNPKLSVSELLQSICDEFHIAPAPTAATPPSVKDYIDALNVFLLEGHAAGHSSVLIIDEAQNLHPEVLEQLRLLTNLETRERKLLQIVLIGQPELRAMLARPEMEQLAQRVIARFHLDALNDAESVLYIQHRMAVAGHTGPLPFDAIALARIHRLTQGVPRRINLLCARALLGAWANGHHRVDKKVVKQAAAEVFGIPGASRTRLSWAYGLAGLGVLTATALAGWLIWSSQSGAKLAPPAAASSPKPAASAPVAAQPADQDSTQRPTPGASAPQPVASVPQAAASVPQALGSAAQTPVPPVAPLPVEELQILLAQLPSDIHTAWRELAPSWKLSVANGDPCEVAAAAQLRCYRAGNLTIPMLRQLGRPGILTLQGSDGRPVYALLVGLHEQTATLRLEQRLHAVRLSALGRLWHGDFATYWRAPPGYSADLRSGASSPAIQHLARQLSQLDGAAPPPGLAVLDAALRERVRAFQRGQGLVPDGQPGPMTFMQIDSATGAAEPRLQTQTR